MGRPHKKGVEYFQHDTNMRDSNPVKALKSVIGRNNAIAFMCVLYELLGQSESFYLDCSNSSIWHVLLTELEMSESDVSTCLGNLAMMGAIDTECWQKKRIVWCPDFINRLKLHMNRKYTRIGPPPMYEAPANEDVRKSPAVEVAETAFGPVEIDHGWGRVEESYAAQIGELPYGLYLDKLRDLYDSLGADIVILAIEYTNRKQPSNMRIYLQRILENWQKSGVSTLAQAQAKITEHENRSNAHLKNQQAAPPIPRGDGEPVRWVE